MKLRKMEDQYMEELKRKLEKGEISRELYDEILRRWDSAGKEHKQEPAGEQDEGRKREGEVNIFGNGTLTDVFATGLRILGKGHVSGNVDVEYFKVAGSASVDGDIGVSGEMEVSGALKAEKSITGGTVRISGSLDAGSIKADHLKNSGGLAVGSGIEAESVEVSGKTGFEDMKCTSLHSTGTIKGRSIKGVDIRISGAIDVSSVECDHFEMKLDSFLSGSTIGSLKAGEVTVRSRRRSGVLKIHELDCHTASLESVKSYRITGDEVVIGDGCEIDYVVARVIKVSGNAVVREKKIPD